MKKVLRLLIPLVVVAAAVGIWRWQGHNGASDEGNLNLYGNVDMREVGLAINGYGRIAEMLVQEGDAVHKGDLLAKLDSDRLQAVAERAAAQVEMQQAIVDRMLAGSRPEDISRARAELAAAEAQARDAARTAERLQTLSKEDLASKEQADNATAAAKAARERGKAAGQVSKLAELGPRQEDIAVAQAQLKQAQAQQALARKELEDANLYAPADGIIRNRILEPGDMASPQRSIYTLALTDPLWVRAYVSESDLGRVRPGMAAKVSSDSFPGKQYRGWLGYISPTAEFTPQSVQTEEMRTQLVYQVRVFVCNPQGELRLGMPVSVHFALPQAQTESGGNDPCHGQ
jgi:HlyD family secretion protein